MKRKNFLSFLLAASITVTGLSLPFGADTAFAASHGTLVSKAKSLIGTPYKFGGTTRKGFDCSGFLNYVFKTENIALPRTASGMYEKGTPVSRSSLRTGDLVFFKTSRSGGISHAGMYIGNGKFVHSASSSGVSISSLNDKYYWANRYAGARRVN
ncbi:cell wall-associated NlpC family hydrolase [Aneurinibacillus soli]|uniref:Murein DD-endopeptidase MepS/Murein LD-carboxypeptidase n=1 Tax=Aneurinibacillus soli TaxID=1500254 RepID=A0A0U5AX36_9BACL|nr:C40 family peptidase [Aneurinibacillus soli]PYE60897.1 cell wall-associated NlpC family hydrolase [Aneurinibacillus soli]BAU26802.1 Murein DD-endopeptidase MepS/Murein LD-carboxypeptidase precursor [Aneurinibacillus soli]